MAKRILIVDDEPDICEILQFNLETEGYEVVTSDAPCSFDDKLPDLILLDVMMTPVSGFEWARQLKTDSRTANIPIIFCTAKTTEYDTLTGFAIGSDDYINKPFRISEVKARVKAVLRRSSRGDEATDEGQSQENRDMLSYEGLILNLDRKECCVDGKNVPFTKLEFELLALLLSKPGHLFSRNKILATVWPDDAMVMDRTVDVNITRIRKKIGRYGTCLKTKIGYGYMFER